VCPLGVVVLRRGFPLAKFVNDECGLESSARLHEIPNKKLESFRCTEIGIGPVEGRSASSLLQFLNLAVGTLSVKGLAASGELKSAGLNAAPLQGLRQMALTTAGILGFHQATFTMRKLNDGPARRHRCTINPRCLS